MAKKIGLIVAGGTGGHVYPALATAKYFKKKGIEVITAGRKNSFEKKVFTDNNYKFKSFSCYKLPRIFNVIEIFKSFFLNMCGIIQLISYILSKKLDFIICFGGYISIPAGISGFLLFKPVFIHEQNSYPGIANRFLGIFSKKVFLTFDSSKEYFFRKNLIHTGNPLRFNKKTAVNNYKIPLNILVIGGSLGAKILNKSIFDLVNENYDKIKDKYVFHISTGKRFYKENVELFEKYKDTVNLYDYIDDMQKIYDLTDFVICRGGATTISEILFFKIPSIIIPGDFATGDHQRKNASVISDVGGGIVINESDLTADKLLETIISIDKKKYLHMVENLDTISKISAEKNIYQVVYDAIR